jgi:hypothetical protein
LVWCEGEEEDVTVGIVSVVEGFDEDLWWWCGGGGGGRGGVGEEEEEESDEDKSLANVVIAILGIVIALEDKRRTAKINEYMKLYLLYFVLSPISIYIIILFSTSVSSIYTNAKW